MIDLKTPSVTVDAAIISDGKIVLIRRANQPFQGMWALPGGFVDVGETVEAACVREAVEETSLQIDIQKLIGVYSDPKRDPRGHTVGIAFLCSVAGGLLKAQDDAKEARWFSLDELPDLAFDHAKVLADLRLLL
jgi:8-oxo-dGTP diphosphatase